MKSSYLLVFISITLSALAQIFMKLGTNRVGTLETISFIEKFLKYFSNIYVLLGLFLYGISALLWIVAISKIPLSVAYPMVGFSYVLVFAMSILFLNEQISMVKILGLILIIFGVITISRS
ncbi:SMR family transporter [Paenibacillus phytohabitans]|uniref:SMR family transporter n=1 Tax=Paenibacillus phytohabitans TaxID=2654978 RepID=UPI00300B99FA